jgi:hypothetical protein
LVSNSKLEEFHFIGLEKSRRPVLWKVATKPKSEQAEEYGECSFDNKEVSER